MSGFTLNHVTVSGNHTRDPEVITSGNGTVICRCRLAVNDRVKNNDTGGWDDRANYFDVTVFGGLGEWLGNNAKKGDQLAVSGRLNWREWEKDGQKRQAVGIIADTIIPITRGNGGGGSSSSSASSGDVPIDTAGIQPQGTLADDDIPF